MYNKDSLLNSNLDFDYGKFLELEGELESGSLVGEFIFEFSDSGIYVISDSGSPAKDIVIAVMKKGGACPSGLVFEEKNEATLLRVGAALKDDIS
mmetsp:Transcript_3720/g.5620  ORF Transcript_3720/g.5620 Transcript_3720/m.5620 type:complete len:95 (+) Transcript_3720:4954-5238(+)